MSATVRRQALLMGAAMSFATALAPHAASAQHLLPATFDKVVDALVGIEGRGCPGGDRPLQGFVVQHEGLSVVTARHGVAGCREWHVIRFAAPSYTKMLADVKVRLVKVHDRADLALLQADDPTALGSAWLRVGPAPPPNTAIYSVARRLGSSGARDAWARVANGSKLLSEIAGAVVSLTRKSSPASDLDIVNIDQGGLIPGTSGAPLVDDTGQVVAIVDGGLEGGAPGINWAIPGNYVTELINSTDPLPTKTAGARSKALFSAQITAAPWTAASAPTVACGAYNLVKVRSDTLDHLSQWSDDIPGLMQILSTTTLDPATTTLDVYLDAGSGATIVVPPGASLQSGPAAGVCTARLGSRVNFTLQMEKTSGLPIDIQTQTASYERQLQRALPPGMSWGVTAAYPFPHIRFDGLTVMRKSVARPHPMFPVPVDMYYVTFAVLGTDLIQYSATTTDLDPWLGQRMMACRQMQQLGQLDQQCQALFTNANDWGRTLVAIHLSTFTVGRTTRPAGTQLPWVGSSQQLPSPLSPIERDRVF